MNAVILCAGFATRMYPLTKDFPKPLLKVVGRPVLDYLIDQVVTLPDIQSIHIVSNAKFFDHFVRWYDERQAGKIFKGISVHIHNDGCADNKNGYPFISTTTGVLTTKIDWELPETSSLL